MDLVFEGLGRAIAESEAENDWERRTDNEYRRNKPKYIDFHMHTTYSDGVSSPELAVKTARLNGLDVIAVTDHDMIAGIPEALEAGRKWDIQVIPGIEVSTDKYHILGLGIDYESRKFQDFVCESAEEQEKVCKARIEVLRKHGIPISFEKLRHYFPKSRLGKFNLCMAMARDKECQEYFREKGIRLTHENYNAFLKDKDGKEIVEKATGITPERAILEIHLAGGLAVIAHPFKEVKDMHELDYLFDIGLDGLEIQPTYNGRNEPFREYAKERGFMITYGSDWHGGLFGRPMLDDRMENGLDERLARALRMEGN